MKKGTLGNWALNKSMYLACFIMLLSISLTVVVCGQRAVEETQKIERFAGVTADVMSYNHTASSGLTEAETTLISQLVSAECRGEPYLCRVAVAAVVLNRIENDGFPDTAVNVIFSVGAFFSVENGTLGLHTTEEDLEISREAVLLAAGGEDPTGGALHFARVEDPRADAIHVCFRAGEMVFGK